MTAPSTVTFLGAAGTTTGSKHLLRHGKRSVLLDCGLFAGLRELRGRNWDKPAFSPGSLDAVVLSHAHVDHSAYLPVITRLGFRGPVWCTTGTADLLDVVLPDSARLQEEDAEQANKHGYSKHKPARPLCTEADARKALKLVRGRGYDTPVTVCAGITATFRRAGHILGSASVDLTLDGPAPLRVVFSGDLGRWNKPILRDPEFVPEADVLLVESTYGDRTHPSDPADAVARLVNDGVKRGDHHPGVRRGPHPGTALRPPSTGRQKSHPPVAGVCGQPDGHGGDRPVLQTPGRPRHRDDGPDRPRCLPVGEPHRAVRPHPRTSRG